MKNKKVLKLITLSLALVVIIAAAVGISASAETSETPSVEITLKNVAYNDYIKVMFAVDHTKAGEGAVIELLYYLEDPSVNPDATAYKGTTYEKGYTDDKGTEETEDDVTYPAFFTAGFPLARIGETVYAKAHIVGTEIYSPVVRYSVAEYLNKRLYVDDATELQDNFYASLLESAGYLQTIFNTDASETNDIENPLSETAYVYIDGKATIDGKYSSGMYALDTALVPASADGSVTLWSVEETTAEGTSSKIVNDGESFNVAGTTIITPAKAEAGSYYEVLGGTDYTGMSWAAVSGVSSLQTMNNLVYYNTNKGYAYDTSDNPARSYAIRAVEGDNSILKMVRGTGGWSDMYFGLQSEASGNCYVFETEIRISANTATEEKNGPQIFFTDKYNNTATTQSSIANPKNGAQHFRSVVVDGAFSHYTYLGQRIEADKWYTITLEYYTDANIVKHYIDGVCYLETALDNDTELPYIGIYMEYNGIPTTTSFDNTVYKAINKAYVAEPAE